ncbi:hypothetical protein O7599_01050 [Streptomyces sp. WMMC500]|uniref:hypothetical protein n=1 Tax=Streptomyces sp. WMMC500 TaxID=3015154 RepID=UPI00248BAE79|nr:hypothetical protein [Streptomyces sp. WMMC500]WBB61177.1 hypothetical protein O7599_01050 [Streptomyces sp. WMMC500]
MRALRIAAAVELLTLAALLINLFTVHTEAVSSLGGPVHGTAYLAVIALTWATTPGDTAPGTRPRSVVPGVGGLLVLRRLDRLRRLRRGGPAGAAPHVTDPPGRAR